MPNLLALVRPNRVHRDTFRLFEIGRVYSAADDSNSKTVERSRLGGISFNQANQPSLEEHFRAIKGTMEDLAVMTGSGPYTFQPCPAMVMFISNLLIRRIAALRQPQQVHPLRPARARRLRPHLPRCSLFDLAAGQPFTPAQILWINFAVNAPFGVALGFDKETPGLMDRCLAHAGNRSSRRP